MAVSGAEAVGGSRPSNENNSVTGDSGRNSGNLGSRELPTPSEVAAEFYERFDPALWELPLTTKAGDTVRRRFSRSFDEEWVGEVDYDGENDEFRSSVKGRRTTAVEAVSWGEAVERLLERHEETRQTTINLERGRPDDALYAEWSVEADNRWMASYQRKYMGQLDALVREVVGGERPSGGETEGAFEEPYVALLGLTGSSVPDGERVGPVRHATALQDAWDAFYQTLRNVLRRLGFSSEEWLFDRIVEPHTSERGGGANLGYAHHHPILLVDGEIEAADLRPAVEAFVEACEYAGMDAHENRACEEHYEGDDWNDADGQCEECEVSVSVRAADELADVAGYMAKYCGLDAVDLLEREPEYVAWAAAMDAGNLRMRSRSDAARHAALADRCKQRCESEKSEQDHDHGEEIVRSVKRGKKYECAECGSPWGIDQEQTLTAHRTADAGPAAADGGRVVGPQHAHTEGTLWGAWPDAREAAAVGESPTDERVRERVCRELKRRGEADVAAIAGRLLERPSVVERVLDDILEDVDPSETVGFDRLPKWRVKSITVGEEEYAASSGGGVDMVMIDPRPESATSMSPGCASCGERELVGLGPPSEGPPTVVCLACGFHPEGHFREIGVECPGCGDGYETDVEALRIAAGKGEHTCEGCGWSGRVVDLRVERREV